MFSQSYLWSLTLPHPTGSHPYIPSSCVSTRLRPDLLLSRVYCPYGINKLRFCTVGVCHKHIIIYLHQIHTVFAQTIHAAVWRIWQPGTTISSRECLACVHNNGAGYLKIGFFPTNVLTARNRVFLIRFRLRLVSCHPIPCFI